ncbi:glycoside hydrolase family 43 protein [Cercospora zeae-maydis SCOH1-5]|uniref:Glycoside hydrolase family 43 protein n=1 Tax=Cercospora zeae-maydis SCOH1-5 TaxID=717836 RepID=A0A6A6FJN8_9PEZI|nr:glycoside hydrolase family 43 protein [Cercospora zeae-maydis SCOH1-5]
MELLLLWAVLVSIIVPASAQNDSSNTYTNPLVHPGGTGGADPWVIRHDGLYYLTYTTQSNITILRSPVLTDWSEAEVKLAFDPPPGQAYSTNLWAPELHNINDKWYIIFTADPNNDEPPPELDALCDWKCPAVNHRMYVLESSGSDPWTSDYTLKGELDTFDQFAIDGTYFQHSSGLYHIYSCWFDKYQSWPANLCITKMSDPWTVVSNVTERQTISVPSNPWEKTPYGRMENIRLSSNEGPQQLNNPKTGQQFVIYSAARSDNRNYCLGQLELVGDDPMNPQDWRKYNEGCVFYQNPLEKAYGVGHASFTTSPDGTEDWIVYHGMENPFSGWSARTIRTQKFGWNDDGSPKFPRPGYGPYEAPSGQNISMKMF